MTFLTDISAGRSFQVRRSSADSGIDRARPSRFAVSAVKEACRIVSALAIIAAIMVALALLQMWIWVPHLLR